jgi:long-subunit fatty acid transport protein
MLGLADEAQAGAAQANYVGNEMQPILDAGAGGYTIPELIQAQLMTPEEGALLIGGLVQLGFSPEVVSQMPASTMQATYFGAAGQLEAQATELTIGSGLMIDQEADVTQTGSAITPIVGLNLSFLEDDLMISAKYEFFTKMDLINETPTGKGFRNGFDTQTGQYTEMFPDGDTTNADIPAFLSIGIRYQISDKVNIQGGYHTYFDKKAGWATSEDGTELIDRNFMEYGLGVEWNVTEKFLLSTGYLAAITGVNEAYQSDLNYSLSTSTFGLGGAIAFNDTFKLQFGGFYTMYNSQTITKYLGGDTENSVMVPYGDTYDKSTWAVSLGLDIAIHKKKK